MHTLYTSPNGQSRTLNARHIADNVKGHSGEKQGIPYQQSCLFIYLLYTELQSTKSCLFSHWALIAIDNSLPLDPVLLSLSISFAPLLLCLSVLHQCFTKLTFTCFSPVIQFSSSVPWFGVDSCSTSSRVFFIDRY